MNAVVQSAPTTVMSNGAQRSKYAMLVVPRAARSDRRLGSVVLHLLLNVRQPLHRHIGHTSAACMHTSYPDVLVNTFACNSRSKLHKLEGHNSLHCAQALTS